MIETRCSCCGSCGTKGMTSKLGALIKDMNIPGCKDFKKKGECAKGDKCRFWHITDAGIARWAGFEHYCEVCSKPVTSAEQMKEHLESKKHKEAVAAGGPLCTP